MQSSSDKQQLKLTYEEIIKKIPLVQIDNEGTFKYILIKVTLNDQEPWYIVRGYKDLEYHKQNFDRTLKRISKSGFQWTNIIDIEHHGKGNSFEVQLGSDKIVFECPGGGRVQHSSKNKQFFVYGYSQSYGQADHQITLQLVKQHTQYPENNYKLSFEGY